MDANAAAEFVWTSARLLDRQRYAHLFEGAPPEPVVAALRPYRNADGGFGNALEPDLRTPASQPAAVEIALRILDEVDRFDDPMVSDACDWLATISTPDGGMPSVLPSARAHPRAPWWAAGDSPEPSLILTGMIAGLLHKRGSDHAWLEGATAWCWRCLEALETAGAYELRGALRFVEHVPDRERAERAFERVAPEVLRVATLDPDAPGEIHTPLDFAPTPDAMARRLFEPAVIDRHLDALAAAQRDDGGWSFNWLAWSPGADHDWRGFVTIEALSTLRANDRQPTRTGAPTSAP